MCARGVRSVHVRDLLRRYDVVAVRGACLTCIDWPGWTAACPRASIGWSGSLEPVGYRQKAREETAQLLKSSRKSRAEAADHDIWDPEAQ